jgi:lipoate-protein ligase B
VTNSAVVSLIKVRAPIRFQDALELQHVHGAELEKSAEKLAKLILLQHPPVFTLGRKTEKHHLLCSEHDLSVRTGAEVIHADRGGSVTYHGPGQVVAYMLLNLRVWEMGIHQHLDLLEDAAIRALAGFGIEGRREQGMTGIWVESGATGSGAAVRALASADTAVPEPVAPSPNQKKICAIGVSARRWVTYHGLSLNVDMELGPFSEVVACGLQGRGVTSMANVLKRSVTTTDVEQALAGAFAESYKAKLEIGMV